MSFTNNPTHAILKGKTEEHRISRFYSIGDYNCFCLEEKQSNGRIHEFWYPEVRLKLIYREKSESEKTKESQEIGAFTA